MSATAANVIEAGDSFGWVREHFDGGAQGYRAGSQRVGWEAAKTLVEEASEYVSFDGPGPLKVMDLGAGTGEVGEAFQALAARRGIIIVPDDAACKLHVSAVELSRKMIAQGLADGYVNEVHIADITKGLPAADHSKNIVTSAGVLQYLKKHHILPLAFESARVLKPGGLAVFTFEDEDSIHAPPKIKTGYNTRYGQEFLIDTFGQAGFTKLKVSDLRTAWLCGQGENRRPVEERTAVFQAPGPYL